MRCCASLRSYHTLLVSSIGLGITIIYHTISANLRVFCYVAAHVFFGRRSVPSASCFVIPSFASLVSVLGFDCN